MDTKGQEVAGKIAGKVFTGFPDVDRRDYLGIYVAYGYDVGIASIYTSKSFVQTPDEWKDIGNFLDPGREL